MIFRIIDNFAKTDFMRIVSHKRLKEFYETKGYEDSRVALERWYDVAEKANWKNLSEKLNFKTS